jgi:hypothetical protein
VRRCGVLVGEPARYLMMSGRKTLSRSVLLFGTIWTVPPVDVPLMLLP